MNEFLLTLKENLAFFLTCLGIFAVLAIIAKAAEKLMKTPSRLNTARTVSYTAVLGAIAALLMFLEIPLFFAPTFYQLDLSEVPVLICAFYLGPVAGVVCELLKILLKLLMKGTSTAFVGDFANFFVGCALVLPASICYHFKKSRKSAVWGMVLGTAVMTVFGSFFNAVYLLPKFSQLFGLPLDAIVAMGSDINKAITNVSTLVLFAVVPFNILKGIVVSVLTLLLYKRVEKIFFHS